MRPTIQSQLHTWFQQDEATAHTSRETMQLLRKYFGKGIVSSYGHCNWPSRFPDLTIPDFFRVGYLKEDLRQQTGDPGAIEGKRQLRKQISGAWTFEAAMVQVLERARACEIENSCRLSNVLFHT